MDCSETVLKELESLQHLHAEQHEQLSLALKRSHFLTQKFKSLLPKKKTVTVHSMPSHVHSIPSGKSHRREDSKESRAAPGRNSRLGFPEVRNRVQSVEQLGFALVFGDDRKLQRSSSIDSGESIQNAEPSTRTSGSQRRPSFQTSNEPSNSQRSHSAPFDLIPIPVPTVAGDVDMPAELPGVLDAGAIKKPQLQPRKRLSPRRFQRKTSACEDTNLVQHQSRLE